MERRLVAVSIVAVIALGVVAAFFLLRDGSDEDGSLATMSARERPFEIAVPERAGPGTPRLTGEALLIGERAGLRFVRLPREDGSSCWSTAEHRSGQWHLASYRCDIGLGRFPDPKQPVLWTGFLQTIPGTQLMVIQSIAGFAADGVKRIGFVDAQDRLIEVTNVVDNVFFTPRPPRDRVKSVAAIDEAGEVIWRSEPVPLPDE
jgi:hypothetical protein